jgi:cytochrome oxidase Cu insertion factor (SCO1/SenC/PrrC family)
MVKNLILLGIVAMGLATAGMVLAVETPATPNAGQPVVQPMLAVAQWLGEPVKLENLKGRVAVLVFFNDASS